MKFNEDIVFSYLDIKPLNSRRLIKFFESTSDREWFFDSYRSVLMLPIYTEGGRITKSGSLNKGSSPLDWTKFASPDLVTYLEDQVFTWMKPRGRVMVLKTAPGGLSSPHIDCIETDFVSFQPKFRIVLQGEVSSLFFITNKGEVATSADDLGRPFVIDGRWPHGMKNDFPYNKYTICIGTPWKGQGLEQCRWIEDNSQVKLYDSDLPHDYRRYFEDLEKRKEKFEN